MASLQVALTIDPNNWAALQELGVLHFRAADYAQTVDAWERARVSSPDNARVLANLSAGYHVLDRYDEATSTLQRAIESSPRPATTPISARSGFSRGATKTRSRRSKNRLG